MSAPRKVRCPVCEHWFDAQRPSARYCSTKCRQIAARDRRRAQRREHAVARAGPGDLERATYAELDAAGAVGTVAGQLALHLARQLDRPDATGVPATARELDRQLRRAVRSGEAGVPLQQPAAPAEADSEDEVARARRERDAKWRAASGSGDDVQR